MIFLRYLSSVVKDSLTTSFSIITLKSSNFMGRPGTCDIQKKTPLLEGRGVFVLERLSYSRLIARCTEFLYLKTERNLESRWEINLRLTISCLIF
jgi:hypothetical protein